ncbi:3-hexulose-6-phosphate synthase [Shouchella shacheensis]|uniref:3-hexulose-6-phosphate synthase n=1 Tax=Shouchella shacheensis TaxID=1649580 RepID=UPI000740493D|nr:3-hexulose-6-phosphate synthase [Shouchella shacheensis]
MKLQLALDRLTWDECLALARETEANVDIIEIGTGVIKEYGMAIVRKLSDTFPEHTILADMKICDAGEHEAKQAFDAGADIATVMAFASDATIQGTHQVAEKYGKQMMIDLLQVREREKVKQLKALGVSFVGLHIGKDQQQDHQLSSALFSLVEDLHLTTSVAGGVTLASLRGICEHSPDVVIVGSAITKADDPGGAARSMRKIMRDSEKR